MGQKINPHGFRLGPVYSWSSLWFAGKKQYKNLLLYDIKLREALQKKLKSAGLAQVDIERSINKIKVTIHVSRPGVVIGRGGSGLEEVKKFIESFTAKDLNKMKVEIAVEPVKEPNLNAYLVATQIADQLVKRLPQKRVCNQAVERVMSAGAGGVKVRLAGRIGGAEISRREVYKAGTIPLSTIRERIDYAQVPALTKSGYVGVKVWICKK